MKVENKSDRTVHKGEKDCHSLHIEEERVREIARFDRIQVSYVLVSFVSRPKQVTYTECIHYNRNLLYFALKSCCK